MSADNSDPHEEGLQRLAHLASVMTTAAEAAVRITSMRRGPSTSSSAPAGRDAPGHEEPSTSTADTAASVPSTAPRSGAEAAATQARNNPTSERPAAEPVAPSSTAAPPPVRKAARPSRRPFEDLYAVHQDALEFYRLRVQDSWVPAYLASRRLEVALADPWAAGYAPAGWTALTDHLRRRGWSDEVLVASGLSRPARTGHLIDHFRDRLVLPIRVGGDVVGFVGRCAEGADSRTPKYLNSPATKIYIKSATLYAAGDLRDRRWWSATRVLVEGPLDAIAVSSCAGDRWVGVALCGTAMSDGHVIGLVGIGRVEGREAIVATDNDRAGQIAAERALRHLAPRCGRLHRLQLPPGLDPADILSQRGPESLDELLTQEKTPLLTAVVEARLQRWEAELQWVEGRVRAARHVAPIIAALPEAALPSACSQLAERLDLLDSTVKAAVEQAFIAQAHASSGSRFARVRPRNVDEPRTLPPPGQRRIR